MGRSPEAAHYCRRLDLLAQGRFLYESICAVLGGSKSTPALEKRLRRNAFHRKC